MTLLRRRPFARLFELLVPVGVLLATSPTRADDDAKSLIDQVWSQYRQVKAEREKLEILLVNDPGQRKLARAAAEKIMEDGGAGVTHKRAVRHSLFVPGHHDKIHLLFSLPAEDAGLGFLILRQPERAQDDMWLYMPGYHKVRRVTLTSRRSLAGTDLIYEDVLALAGERTEDFTYDDQRDEEIDGRSCAVIIAEPKPDTVTAYSKRKIWIDRERLFPLKAEFYDVRGDLWKVLRNTDVHEVTPGVWRSGLTEMRDLQGNRATLLWAAERAIGVAIREEIFTKDYLEHPAGY